MKNKSSNKFVVFISFLFCVAISVLSAFFFVKNFQTVKQAFVSNQVDVIYIVLFCIFLISIFVSGLLLGHLVRVNIDETAIRKDATSRSRAVLEGLAVEQVAPFLPDFPCSPSDVRFVGKPVDFVGFPGMTAKGKIDEILIIEVKTGSSNLSDIEKQIKTAVQNKNIKYVEYRPKV